MNAIEGVGREMTAQEVIDDVEGDRLFYDTSGGGVTFSGGEPLLQWQFLETCLKLAKEKGLHTAIETSGFAPREAVERVAPFTDLFLYDLKHITKEGSLKYTGVDNQIAKDNLRELSERGSRVIVRTVVVPGANADRETLEGFAEFFSALPQIEMINILPLHKSASEKYNRLEKDFLIADYRIPTEEEMEEVAAFYRARGFEVKIGG
jgi:pyruvate formate lyase activating enzyme